MKILFATANRGKLREAAEVLGPGFEIVSPLDLGITEDIPETGSTLQENSLQKARYLFERTGLPCFADDTGLEVDALGGAPGIYSARYAGPGHDSEANMARLLRELGQVAQAKDRGARFRTVVTLRVELEAGLEQKEGVGIVLEVGEDDLRILGQLFSLLVLLFSEVRGILQLVGEERRLASRQGHPRHGGVAERLTGMVRQK